MTFECMHVCSEQEESVSGSVCSIFFSLLSLFPPPLVEDELDKRLNQRIQNGDHLCRSGDEARP